MTVAKEAKKSSKKSAKKSAKRAAPKFEAPEFGVPQLAKHLGVEAATVRVKLRTAKIKKDGRGYDFKNKAGMLAVAKKLEGVGAAS